MKKKQKMENDEIEILSNKSNKPNITTLPNYTIVKNHKIRFLSKHQIIFHKI